MTDYVADKKVCQQCPLRCECTNSKVGRSIARHWKEASLEVALAFTRLPEAQADRRRRRHLMEGSFAQAANKHHFKRSRWRPLFRQQIQDWIIAAVQNVALLCGANPAHVAAIRPQNPKIPGARSVFAAFTAGWRQLPVDTASYPLPSKLLLVA